MGFILNPYRFAAADSLPVSGAVLWLDASDTGTLTLSGSTVTQWDDKSGNGYHHTQVNDPNGGPVSGTRTVNSLNGLDFQGNMELRSASSTSSPPITNASDGSCTIFAVATTDSTSGVRNLFDQDGRSDRIAQHIRLNGSTSQTIQFSSASTPRTDDGATVSTSTAYIFRMVNQGASGNCEMFVNAVSAGGTSMGGAASPSSTYASATSVGRITSGATQFWDGVVCEIIAYDTDLSSGDIDLVEAYLADKWGITL